MCVFWGTMSPMQADDLKLWYKQPAKEWVEALPIGNSSMAAMVYGGVPAEELQLNEETMWAGGPCRNDSPEALAHLEEARSLIFSGRNMEAQQLVDRTFYSLPGGMPYLTLGSLLLEFPGHEEFADYRRELDLSRAVAVTTYRVDGVSYEREVFASLPARVIVMRLKASRPGALSFSLRYACPLSVQRVSADGKCLVLTGRGEAHEASLFVAGAVNHALDLCPSDGACAHNAWLYRYVYGAVGKVFASKIVRGGGNSLHFGVCRNVVQGFSKVVRP